MGTLATVIFWIALVLGARPCADDLSVTAPATSL